LINRIDISVCLHASTWTDWKWRRHSVPNVYTILWWFEKFYSFFFYFDINVSIFFFFFFIQHRPKNLFLSLVRYPDQSDSWTTYTRFTYTFDLFSLSLLSCSNGHAIWNRTRGKKRNENRRVKWFEHVTTSVGM
jgi:hypothetical protein